ncbi:adenylate cyclase [Pseudomonas syringae CC1557]|uniref:Adenylate cyclase n=1 Tax=Pseudomonas syringae CC1557 TaxID=1357279 RepID=W0MJR6_PSESX|nr:class I adenylate cyclase [Pseudomonas syringae]AHG38854.1 adenylate cyclase [Pseudomonas syringae CC1557]
MTRNPEIRPDLDEGIDRKVLSQLRNRFLSVNDGRYARALEGMSTRQQSVMTLLPLFFHVNHPLLPGYVSGATPAGVSHYEPGAQVLSEAQRLTRSFSYKARHGNPPQPIHGLFLMGSLGTLAQAEQSDMDVWVCYDSTLEPEAIAELRKKCKALETWAATMGAEAHFFLIDPERFRRGDRDSQLSSDDCGTTQHYLLLDEFYRTAIWLAGRTPMWWLVPVYEEQNYQDYTHTLLSKRFIRASEVLDLGPMSAIPPAEFVGAGLWQLFKGIESPYKSVLKLLLIEVYSSEHPRVQCLSLRFKQAVFANQLDLDELDPYVVVYRRIEEHLQARKESERLELVRRSLYLKVNKKLTGSPRLRSNGWQRLLLERLTLEWGWDDRNLTLLDSRSQWKVRQVVNERRALVNELNYSYRFQTQFARTQSSADALDARDLTILGRRLYAAFERKAGKIEFINPGIAPDLAEDTLTLVHSPNKREPGKHQWALYNGNLGIHEWANFLPIKRSRELLDILTWCHRNSVIDATTRMALHPGISDLTEFELFNLLAALQQSIELPMSDVSDEALLQPSVPKEILLLVNVGVDPLRHHRDLNILMTTHRTDSLSYAGVRENLVLTLDQITLNTWNETLVSRYDGPHALLDCMSELLASLPEHGQQPQIRVRCFCHNRAPAIAQRVEELISTAQLLLARKLNHRYLIQVQQQYHVLEIEPGRVGHIVVNSLPGLFKYLGEELPRYSPLHLDPQALDDHDLALILPFGQPECIQVFYRINEPDADLYVLDEHNSLWHQRVPYHDEPSLLIPLQRFFHSLVYRRGASLPLDNPFEPVLLETLYYQVLPSGAAVARRIEHRQAPTAADKSYYDVQAIIEETSPGQINVTLYCDNSEFSELEYGDQLYAAVAQQILGKRQEPQRYRSYITDLDLSGLLDGKHGQSILFLRHKAELEKLLNEAMDQA